MDIAKINSDIEKIQKNLSNKNITPALQEALKKHLESLQSQIQSGAAASEKKEDAQVAKTNDARKELENAISKIKKGLNNKAVPDSAKGALKRRLEDSEKKLAAIEKEEQEAEKQKAAEKEAVKEVVAEVKTVIADVKDKKPAKAKATIKKAKEKVKKIAEQKTSRTKKSAKGEKTYKKVVDELTAFIKGNKALSVVYKGASKDSLQRDASRHALPPGKRISTGERTGSTKGAVYYERRRNRSDFGKRKRYPWFEDGGEMVNPDGVAVVTDAQLDKIEQLIMDKYGYEDTENPGRKELSSLIIENMPELDMNDANVERAVLEGLEGRGWTIEGLHNTNNTIAGEEDDETDTEHEEETEEQPTVVTTMELIDNASAARELIPASAKKDGQKTIIRDGTHTYTFTWYGGENGGAVEEADDDYDDETEETDGTIVNQYEGRTPAEVWDAWSEDQRAHFMTDHIEDLHSHVSLDRIDDMKERSFGEVPFVIKSCVKNHVETGQYKKGGKMKQGKPQGEHYSSASDKKRTAKPVGWRFTEAFVNSRTGKRLKVTTDSVPTKEQIEKYKGETFSDGERYMYEEMRADHSDKNAKRKLEKGGKTEKKLKQNNSPEWHRVQVAKKTMNMTPEMAVVMGGMTIEEAKKILDKYNVKYKKGGAIKQTKPEGEHYTKKADAKRTAEPVGWRFTAHFLKTPAAKIRGLKFTTRPTKADIEKYKDKKVNGHRYIYEEKRADHSDKDAKAKL